MGMDTAPMLEDRRTTRPSGRGKNAPWTPIALVVVLAVGLGAAILVNEKAVAREAELAATLDAAQKRVEGLGSQVDDLTTRLSNIEQRLRKTETAVASEESKKQAIAAERGALGSAPSKLIRSVEVFVNSGSSGIFTTRSWSRAYMVKLSNKSRFNVTAIKGNLEFRRTDGSLVGAVPAQITGTLLAGQTADLSVSAAEVTSIADGKQSRLVVESVSVLGGDD